MANETVKPYVVYHLMRDQLEAMDRGGAAADKDVVKLYRGLVSNAPRVHPSDLEEHRQAASAERMKRKCSSALLLFKLGYYEKVCSVNADCATYVLEMTNDINRLWYTNTDKNIELHADHPRSTAHYDLIVRFGKPFLCMPLGFIDLEEHKYETGIV